MLKDCCVVTGTSIALSLLNGIDRLLNNDCQGID